MSARAYYNEFDAHAAQWLRNLIAAGHIAAGDVDERSIVEVQSDDLRGYEQCHFFAGIGGWSLALRLAGWDDARPVWTGSCPCQPFSAAGRGLGEADERHLWPEFRRLIAECRPAAVFGEQVASRAGRDWLARVRADLEALGYGVGAADLGAASVGAPHIRQRLWWVADGIGVRRERRPDPCGSDGQETTERREGLPDTERRGVDGRLADAGSERRQQVAGGASGDEGSHGRGTQGDHIVAGAGQDLRELADGERIGRKDAVQHAGSGVAAYGGGQQASELGMCGASSGLADTDTPEQREQRRGGLLDGERPACGDDADGCGAVRGPWSNYAWLPCADGKARRIEPGLEPLAHGVPGRVGLLRGYGNAIVPQVAATFIRAAMPEAAA